MDTNSGLTHVLLVEDDPEYAELVRHWLASSKSHPPYVLTCANTLSTALIRLKQGPIDVVLLDLKLPDGEGIETFATLSAHIPDISIIVLSSSDSEALAVDALRRGADSFLVKATSTPDLVLRALSYAVARRGRAATLSGRAEPLHGRVVGLAGVKGGTGCTTVACTLASELHRQTKGSVLLADFDLATGLVAFMMGVVPRYSVVDVIHSLDRLDKDVWDALVTDVGGVHVLASAAAADHFVEPETLGRIIGFAIGLYDWVVVDFGRIEAYLALREQISEALLITTNGIPSLFRAKQCVASLKAFGMEQKPLTVIMNNAHQQAIAPNDRDLRAILGTDIYARLPNDEFGLQQALAERRLPDDKSPVRHSIAEIARKLAGLAPSPPKSRRLPELASLFRRPKMGPLAGVLAKTEIR